VAAVRRARPLAGAALLPAWRAQAPPPAPARLYPPILWDDVLQTDGHRLPKVSAYVATLDTRLS
jgi:hypothetical protein